MDFSGTRSAIDDMIRSFGTSCKLEKVDGTSATTIGVLLSGQTASTPQASNSFVTKVNKICYLSGKITQVPKPGDAVTFKPNTYVIKQVRAIAVGEGKTNVFAYKLELST